MQGEAVTARQVGEFASTRIGDKVWIDVADPRIIVTVEFLDMVRQGTPHATLDGDALKLYGCNRTVIYRIGEKVPDRYAYYAEWPD